MIFLEDRPFVARSYCSDQGDIDLSTRYLVRALYHSNSLLSI
jgi:hypothetical protein